MSVQLKSIGEVFSETSTLCKSRALPIIAVILLSTVVIIFFIIVSVVLGLALTGGPDALSGNLQEMKLTLPMIVAGSLMFLLLFMSIIWSQASTLAVTVDQELGIMGGLKAGFKYLLPMAWVGILYSSIVMTGFILFMVPGMILALSLCLCFYIMIAEGRSGMDTIIASRLYIKGHWWNTFFKFFLVWLLSIGLNLIPVIGQFISLIFTPFVLLFMLVVYRDLKEAAGDINTNFGSRLPWALMAAAGILLPVFGLIGLLVTLGSQLPSMLQQLSQGEFTGTITTEQRVKPAAMPTLPSAKVVVVPPAPKVKRLQSLDGSIIWRDPTGDTNNPLLDIKEVTAITAEDGLTITLTLARPVANYFAAAKGGDFSHLFSFFLDTDVDRETGGDPFAGPGRSGYDMSIDLLLSVDPDTPKKGEVSGSLYTLNGQERKSLGAMDADAVTVSGSVIHIRLPYTMLHVKGRETIRGCYRETDQKQGSGLARDQLIPLN